MLCIFRCFILILGIGLSNYSYAHTKVSIEDFELLMRAHFFDGHQLPPNSLISNASPKINNRGDVAIKISALSGEPRQAIWYKAHNKSEGEVIYQGPLRKMLSDVSINELGEIAFNQYEFGDIDGVFKYLPGLGVSLAVDPKNFPGSDAFSFIEIDDLSQISFRRLHLSGLRDYIVVSGELSSKTLIREGHNDISFIFRPTLSGDYRVVKVRKGKENSNEIRLYQGADYEVIARDTNGQPDSSFIDFDNAPAVSKKGDVAFVARLRNSKKALFLWESSKKQLREIAREGRDFHQLEAFSPVINIHGLLAIRAIDHEAKRSIFVFNTHSQKAESLKLISEGDYLFTDRETARVMVREGFPGFSAQLDLNDDNQLVFHAVLERKDGSKSIGSGIYQIGLSSYFKNLEKENAL